MFKSLELVLLGIGIGILIAPDKGSETRRKIAGTFSDYKDDAEYYLLDAADKVKSKVKGVASSVKDKAKDFADEAENTAGNLKDDAKNKADDLNDKIQNA